MAALEVGTLGDGGAVGGDAQLGTAWMRCFHTLTPAGFPQLITVYAYAALTDPNADPESDTATRDVLEQMDVSTYLAGADPLEDDAVPFDSETSYSWPVDWWPASCCNDAGQPTMDALEATARAHVANLSRAWLDSLPAPLTPPLHP